MREGTKLENNSEELTGGRIGKISRQGDVVVRPANVWTPAIHRFLRFLHEDGADFVPIPYGINEHQQEIVSYMPGEVYNDPLPELLLQDAMLLSAAELLARFHSHSVKYVAWLEGNEPWMLPAQQPAEVMCHGDYAPYNVTISGGKAVGIIDFDTLHPGPRMWDVAYGIYRWVPFTDPARGKSAIGLEEQIRKARLFLDAYGMDAAERRSFVPMLLRRLTSLTDYMQQEAAQGNADFQQHIQGGHLQVYWDDMDYLREHEGRIKL